MRGVPCPSAKASTLPCPSGSKEGDRKVNTDTYLELERTLSSLQNMAEYVIDTVVNARAELEQTFEESNKCSMVEEGISA